MSCLVRVYLKEPGLERLEADANVSFELGCLLWADDAKSVPFDITGFSLRGGIGTRSGQVITTLKSFVPHIETSDPAYTLVWGQLLKEDVEDLPIYKPLIYDLTLDNGTFSFSCVKGHVIFIPGVSQ